MPSSVEPLIRLRAARLGYRGEQVLQGVDLEIGAGQGWFVLGPNGSGKSTLLRTILGLVEPLGGEVWRSPERARLVDIGFVPQVCQLSSALPTTVREFVSLGAIRSARAPADRVDDLAWALARVGLASKEDKNIWSLSGGQRQRALLARALIRRPGVLILDEPTEGLDAASEEAFLATLGELSREVHTTLVLVTHRLDLALRHATHVALVHKGTIESGERVAVLSSANVERVFGRALAEQLFPEARPT